MVLGPHQTFGNAPRSIEHAVEFIVGILGPIEEKGYTYAEAKEDALLIEGDSWMTGVNKNVAGKTVWNVGLYVGSTIQYRKRCELSRIAIQRSNKQHEID